MAKRPGFLTFVLHPQPPPPHDDDLVGIDPVVAALLRIAARDALEEQLNLELLARVWGCRVDLVPDVVRLLMPAALEGEGEREGGRQGG